MKLDRGFFMGGETERGVNVVKAVFHMAKELHMKTVAESIDTSSLVNFLKEEGCDMVQGYVFCKLCQPGNLNTRYWRKKVGRLYETQDRYE